MLSDNRTSLRSSKPRSPKPIVGTERECNCDPETLGLKSPNVMGTGIVCWCPSCNIVGTLFFADMMSLNPLKFNQPLRGK